MVKVVDMQRNDLTVRFLLWLESYRNSASRLETDAVLQAVRQSISDNMPAVEKFGGIGRMPAVVFHHRCRDDGRTGVDFFPVYFRQADDSINVCLDRLKDEAKTAEHFIRELYVARLPAASGLTADENRMRSCFVACRESLAVYKFESAE